MSLADFKQYIKHAAIFAFLVGYAASFFYLGKGSYRIDLAKVKGASAQKTIRSPVESPIPFADTQSHAITASFVRLCSNTVHGFELTYPKDWFTTYNSEDQRCLFYAPYSFVLPYDVSDFKSPIQVEVIRIEDWETTSKFYENPNDSFNVLSAENVQVGAFFAKKVEAQATGSGQIPQGFARTTYLIFGSTPMAITYSQQNIDEDTKAAQKTLEEMVKSLGFL